MVGDIEGNASIIINACKKAKQQYNADIVLFPELALVGYPPEDLLLRPDFYQRCDKAVELIQKQVDDMLVVLGVPIQSSSGIYNAAIVIQQGKIIAEYHKQALPNYSVFDEKRYFVAGNESCVIDVAGIPMGLTICEDIWEAQPVEKAVTAGAKMILNINASPYHTGKDRERHDVVRQHVLSHAVPFAYLNLVGGQDELVFDGESFVMDKHGSCVFQAPAFADDLYLVEIGEQEGEPEITQQSCAHALQEEQSVYGALVLGVRDYVHKNGFDGAVVGLSGGIDSALTLAIAADAIGSAELEAVLMPSRYTADMSVEDAVAECESLQVPYHIISIEPAFNAFLDMLKDAFEGRPVDTTEENIQARCRGLILMAISNKKRKMVLTTGNKSEMAVGYSTLYGDMAGAFDVLKDVPKTLVYRLAAWRNTQGQVIPQRVIDRPPSAELAPDQKDVDSLPDYDTLDAILHRYVEQDQSQADIVAAGFDEQIVSRIIMMVDTAEYKRRQAPPGVRITRRAFSRDRRYPITSAYHRKKALNRP